MHPVLPAIAYWEGPDTRWALVPILPLVWALLLRLSISTIPLNFLPDTLEQLQLVTINLDMVFLATLLDTAFGLVLGAYMKTTEDGSTTHTIRHSPPLLYSSVIVIILFTIRVCHACGPLFMYLQGRDGHYPMYRHLGSVLLVKGWRPQQVCSFGLFDGWHTAIETGCYEELRSKYVKNSCGKKTALSAQWWKDDSYCPLARSRMQTNKIKNEVQQLQNRIARAVTGIRKQINPYEKRIKALELKIDTLKGRLEIKKFAEEEAHRLQHELFASQNHLGKLYAEMDEMIGKARDKIDSLRAQRAERDQELGQLREANGRLEGRVEDQTKLLEDAMRLQIQVLTDGVTDRKALEAAQLDKMELEVHLTRQSTELREVRDKHADALKTIEDIREESAAFKREAQFEKELMMEEMRRLLFENEALREQARMSAEASAGSATVYSSSATTVLQSVGQTSGDKSFKLSSVFAPGSSFSFSPLAESSHASELALALAHALELSVDEDSPESSLTKHLPPESCESSFVIPSPVNADVDAVDNSSELPSVTFDPYGNRVRYPQPFSYNSLSWSSGAGSIWTMDSLPLVHEYPADYRRAGQHICEHGRVDAQAVPALQQEDDHEWDSIEAHLPPLETEDGAPELDVSFDMNTVGFERYDRLLDESFSGLSAMSSTWSVAGSMAVPAPAPA